MAGPRERLAANVAEAVAAAEAIGFPVVLKGLIAGMVHKTEAGLVAVGMRSADEVARAAAAMLERARAAGGPVPGFLVQEQVRPVAEIFIGARIDPDFGPLIAVGAGGVQVELYRDIAVRLAPVDDAGALEALRSTQVSRLLDGFRGKPRADVNAAAKAISAVSQFAAHFADVITEMEVNPLAVLAEGAGCSALDCVIIARAERTGKTT